MRSAHLARPLAILCGCAIAAALCCGADQPRFEPHSFPYSGSVQVAYDVAGMGNQTMILLHSMGSSKESWDPLMPGLLAVCDCQIYRVDLKGHGGTSAPNDHRYSLRENADIVAAFVAALKLKRAILMGHSYGGAVALETALNAKKEGATWLQALILIGTPGVLQKFPFMEAHHRYEAYGKMVDHLTTPHTRAWIAVHARNHGDSSALRSRVALYTRLWSDPARSRAARETARQFLDGGGLAELAARDHDTGVPTLLIGGEHDPLVGVKRLRQLAHSINGSRLSIIPGTAHAPHEDAPELVIPVISEFLKLVR